MLQTVGVWIQGGLCILSFLPLFWDQRRVRFLLSGLYCIIVWYSLLWLLWLLNIYIYLYLYIYKICVYCISSILVLFSRLYSIYYRMAVYRCSSFTDIPLGLCSRVLLPLLLTKIARHNTKEPPKRRPVCWQSKSGVWPSCFPLAGLLVRRLCFC